MHELSRRNHMMHEIELQQKSYFFCCCGHHFSELNLFNFNKKINCFIDAKTVYTIALCTNRPALFLTSCIFLARDLNWFHVDINSDFQISKFPSSSSVSRPKNKH
eukprot:TRINITY_DN8918_c0_g2_i2.p1 TRINITY_DN8918_c0_g2~~TRINITY_DN8918_c0_g2_i2.p1  ORF type:complete len:105 (+),score=6.37 TRINITY_DN8918_c0_g2_i2:593-907(+)